MNVDGNGISMDRRAIGKLNADKQRSLRQKRLCSGAPSMTLTHYGIV